RSSLALPNRQRSRAAILISSRYKRHDCSNARPRGQTAVEVAVACAPGERGSSRAHYRCGSAKTRRTAEHRHGTVAMQPRAFPEDPLAVLGPLDSISTSSRATNRPCAVANRRDHADDDRQAECMKSLRVLSIASEIFPLIKIGELADVTGALP